MSRMRTKLVRNLTPQERLNCRRLTLRTGSMRGALNYSIQWDEPARVFMIEDKGRLLAWALLFPYLKNEPWAYFYTRKTCRRRGYGTWLFRAVKQREADAKVCWWPGYGGDE